MLFPETLYDLSWFVLTQLRIHELSFVFCKVYVSRCQSHASDNDDNWFCFADVAFQFYESCAEVRCSTFGKLP